MNENTKMIVQLSDGERSSIEIAKIVGLSPRYVRKVVARHGLPRLGQGAQRGEKNHQFVTGRNIDLDGYVLVAAPEDHPNYRRRPNRPSGKIAEHRLVMERKLGRYLSCQEVVDHIDGLTLHNAPSNLRLFASNADHLRETLKGQAPKLSHEGYLNTGTRTDLGQENQPVDNYRLRRGLGEIRLRQILLAAWSLGTDSPFLLGTHRHTEQVQIDWSSRSKIERALADLYQKWGWPHAQLERECHRLYSQTGP